MVTRCCPGSCVGGKKSSRRKSAPEDRKRLIDIASHRVDVDGGGGKKKKKKRRPASGDSAVSNSTFASAVSSPPHNYEDECDARLEGQSQAEDEDHRVRAAAVRS